MEIPRVSLPAARPSKGTAPDGEEEMKSGRKSKKNRATHVTKGIVFDDLGLGAKESAAAKIKADLLLDLLKIVKSYDLTQKELSKILDQPQPRISELLNGKISKMSIEKLLEYLELLGAHATVTVTAPRRMADSIRESMSA